MVEGTLLYGLATLIVGLIGLIVRYAFKSKCTNVDLCCGCLTIKRNVDAENEIETKELEHSDTKERDIEMGTPSKMIKRQTSI